VVGVWSVKSLAVVREKLSSALPRESERAKDENQRGAALAKSEEQKTKISEALN